MVSTPALFFASTYLSRVLRAGRIDLAICECTHSGIGVGHTVASREPDQRGKWPVAPTRPHRRSNDPFDHGEMLMLVPRGRPGKPGVPPATTSNSSSRSRRAAWSMLDVRCLLISFSICCSYQSGKGRHLSPWQTPSRAAVTAITHSSNTGRAVQALATDTGPAGLAQPNNKQPGKGNLADTISSISWGLAPGLHRTYVFA